MNMYQQIASLKGSYIIENEAGDVLYTAKGKSLWRRKQTIYDREGKEAARMELDFRGLRYEFTFWIDGKRIGNALSNWNPVSWIIDFSCFNWTGRAPFPTYTMEITDQNGRIVGIIDRKLLHMTDHYRIEYDRAEDTLPMVLCALAFDSFQDGGTPV